MRPPAIERRLYLVDDLPVEIEAQVVARGEDAEPLVADADHPDVDFLDDRVRHRVRAFELSEVAAGSKPPVNPSRGAELGPGANRRTSSHGQKHRLSAQKPLGVARKSFLAALRRIKVASMATEQVQDAAGIRAGRERYVTRGVAPTEMT